MVGNVLKIIITIVLGYALGWLFGSMLGALLGAIPAFFFGAIVELNLVAVVSLALALLVGATLGFLATQIGNRLSQTSDNPTMAVTIGMFLGVIFLLVDGMLGVAEGAELHRAFNLMPIVYTGIVGADIGSLLFPLLGTVRVLREIIESSKEVRSNRERLKEIQVSLGMNSSEKEKSG